MGHVVVLVLLSAFCALSQVGRGQRVRYCNVVRRCYDNRPAVRNLYDRAVRRREDGEPFEMSPGEMSTICRDWPAISACVMDNVWEEIRFNLDCNGHDERNHRIFLSRMHYACADFEKDSSRWEPHLNCLVPSMLMDVTEPPSQGSCYIYFNRTEYMLNDHYHNNRITLNQVRHGICRAFTEHNMCLAREQYDACGAEAGRLYAHAQGSAMHDWARQMGYECTVYGPSFLDDSRLGLGQVCLKFDECYRGRLSGDFYARAQEDNFYITRPELDEFCKNQASLSQCLSDRAAVCSAWNRDARDLLMMRPDFVCASEQSKTDFMEHHRCLGKELFQFRRSRSACYTDNLQTFFNDQITAEGKPRNEEEYRNQVCGRGVDYLNCESDHIQYYCGWRAANYWLAARIANSESSRKADDKSCVYEESSFYFYNAGEELTAGVLSILLLCVTLLLA